MTTQARPFWKDKIGNTLNIGDTVVLVDQNEVGLDVLANITPVQSPVTDHETGVQFFEWLEVYSQNDSVQKQARCKPVVKKELVYLGN